MDQLTSASFNWKDVEPYQGPPKPERVALLVKCPVLVIHQAGELRVYGPDNIRPLFLNLPSVNSIGAELKLEQLVDEILPWSHRDIYWPGCLRGGGWTGCESLTEFAARVDLAQFDSALLARTPWDARHAIMEVMSQ